MKLDITGSLRLVLLVIGILLLVMLIAACGGGSPSPTPTTIAPSPQAVGTPLPGATRAGMQHVEGTPGRTLNLKGLFAFVGNDGNLSIEDANTSVVRVLIKTSTDGYAQSPAFSPDGKQVAYSYNAFTKDGFVKSELHVVNVDGSNDRKLSAPDDMKITLDFPTWSPDGKFLYVTQSYPVPPSDQHVEIDRISAGGGALAKVVDGGYEAHISPDGKKMSYQVVDFKTYTSSLWVANVDGSSAKQIMQNGAFAAIFGARFSPDGQTIVFAGSGPPRLKLPGYQALAHPNAPAIASELLTQGDVQNGCYFSVWFVCVVETAQAHGLPWDLWLVDPAGQKYERLTEIGADSPVPVWSKDGKYISFFEATGIYLLDREKKAIYSISGIGGYGGFDWTN